MSTPRILWKWPPLVLAGACLVVAAPVLVTIDTLLMWKITLGVTEYGHRLALVPVLLGVVSWRKRQRLAAGAALAAALTLLVPLMQAVKVASTLPREVDTAFRITEAAKTPPLVLRDLWLGRAPDRVEAKRLVYARDGDEERALLFHASQTRRPAPCLIVIHSGGWDGGSAEEFPEWNHHWAREGYAVAAIEYRLAPRWRWPAQRDDVAAALTFLKAQAATLGVDAERFVLIGRSAGGQIATAAACGLNDATIRGCISLYAPADMPFAWKYADPADVLDSPRLLRQYLGGSEEEAPELYRDASATLIATASSPPMLMIHGQRDTLVWHRQSERLAAKLGEVGVPHFHLSLPWATHALDYPFHGPGAQLTRYSVGRFLEKITQ